MDGSAPVAADAGRRVRAENLASLAGLFAVPPAPATVAELRRAAAGAAHADLAGDTGLAHGLALVFAAIAEEADDAALAARLERQFGLLFLGIGGPLTLAPYESAWRGDGRLFQAPVAEMDRLLADLDLHVGLAGEPSDHVAVEVGLLAHLVAADHAARPELATRLADWLPAFRDALVVQDASGFYTGAATALLAAVSREQAA